MVSKGVSVKYWTIEYTRKDGRQFTQVVETADYATKETIELLVDGPVARINVLSVSAVKPTGIDYAHYQNWKNYRKVYQEKADVLALKLAKVQP